ncbi:MAG: OmpA family protein [Lewinellaceae bacterium]|nr:OmpA family protein [Lewinellaceae bacterium]
MNAWKLSTTIFCLLIAGQSLQGQTEKGKVTIEVKNELNINTEGLEFSPTFYEDGIVFISTNTLGAKKVKDKSLDLPAMSIIQARRNPEGLLMAPTTFSKELTSQFHEGPVCFDRTAETVYFSRNVTTKGRQKLAKDGIQKMKLYSSTKTNGVWSDPQPLPFNNNQFDDCHPGISIDGDKLYFSSNRPGGFGGMDLYVAYKVGDSWSEPVNLGSEINTEGNEFFPFVHADNTLYFASDGLPGVGGIDMFYAVPDGDGWTKPVNFGAPFNTAGDDFGMIVDLNKINGYYNSNGQGGSGKDDIFNFHVEGGNLDDYFLQNDRIPVRDLDLAITVTDKMDNKPVEGADIHIINLANANVIGRDESGKLITLQNIDGQDVMVAMDPDQGLEGLSDRRGKYSTTIKSGQYAIIVSKSGYQTKQVQIPLTKPGNEIAVALERAEGKVHWIVSVFNSVTNTPLAGSSLVLSNNVTGKKDTLIVDANGMVDYYLDLESAYNVDVVQGGRKIGNASVDTKGHLAGDTITQSILVAPIMPGASIELPNIYYNFNDATLRPDARKDLDLVLALLKQQPTVVLELASHTDCRGTAQYNEDLSQRRANGVVKYLLDNSVNPDRLKAVGGGESQPRNKGIDGVTCTEAEHARNRRTEIRVLTGVEGASLVLDGKVDTEAGPDVTKPADKPVATNTPVSTVSVTGSMQYYVIAGSFLMENRAQNHLATVKAAGYPNAEVVQFPESPYFSVAVGKFDDRNEAIALKKAVIAGKIDAFVRAVGGK